MPEHSPLPWLRSINMILDANGEYVAITGNDLTVDSTAEEDAKLLVQACNSHDDLVSACRAASEHVQELRDAWQRGALDERDGKGGLRSNRNVDVDVALRKALAKATGGDDA